MKTSNCTQIMREMLESFTAVACWRLLCPGYTHLTQESYSRVWITSVCRELMSEDTQTPPVWDSGQNQLCQCPSKQRVSNKQTLFSLPLFSLQTNCGTCCHNWGRAQHYKMEFSMVLVAGPSRCCFKIWVLTNQPHHRAPVSVGLHLAR